MGKAPLEQWMDYRFSRETTAFEYGQQLKIYIWLCVLTQGPKKTVGFLAQRFTPPYQKVKRSTWRSFPKLERGPVAISFWQVWHTPKNEEPTTF